jgi:septum formation protein
MQNTLHQNDFQYVLGSASPRRFELLNDILPNLSQQPIHAEESFPKNLEAVEVAQYLAEKKADQFPWTSTNQVLITADTTVILEDAILNKPETEEEAFDMLHSLSNREHTVCSAYCLEHKGKRIAQSDFTRVLFNPLSSEEIMHYIHTYKPFDKAGSYGIQEWIGRIGIREIQGSYYTVMGLPTDKLYNDLKKIKWI